MDNTQRKQLIVSTFNKVAEGYNCPVMRYFPCTADKIASGIAVIPEMKVLDIACGTGVVATAIAQTIAPARGRVFAIDLARNMLDQVEAQMLKMNLDNIDLHHMDAEVLDFGKGYFDLAISSFGLFFMSDMEVALKEWLRVIKPAGEIIFSSFTDTAFQPMVKVLCEDLEAFGVKIESGGNFEKLQQAAQCEALLVKAGADRITIESAQMGYHLACAEDWWEIVNNSGYRAYVDQIDTLELGAFRQQHVQKIGELAGEKGIWMDVSVLICRGHKMAG